MLFRIHNGYSLSFEGGIALHAEFIQKKGNLKDLFNRLLGKKVPDSDPQEDPPYRIIKVTCSDGTFWNFREQRFAEYDAEASRKKIHISEEAYWQNFFNSYWREHECKEENTLS